MSPPGPPSASEARVFRFVPRFRALAIGAMITGALVIAAGAGFSATGRDLGIAIALGAVGILLGAFYLRSPTWRITVTANAAGLIVARGGTEKFRIAWSDIDRVITTAEKSACYIRTDSAQTSLLIPGPDAPAPYDIADKADLIAHVLAHAPKDRIDVVDSMRVSPLPPRTPPPRGGGTPRRKRR